MDTRSKARKLTLKYDATCRSCGANIPAGSVALYYGPGKVYGIDCHEYRPEPKHTREELESKLRAYGLRKREELTYSAKPWAVFACADDGIAAKFLRRPSADIRSGLKALGFAWEPQAKAWFAPVVVDGASA